MIRLPRLLLQAYSEKTLAMIDLPTDIANRIKEFVASGYASSEEVLREALSALATRDADLAAIREGIADEAAGRVQPARQALRELRTRHGLTES